jgi:hypothetical protein
MKSQLVDSQKQLVDTHASTPHLSDIKCLYDDDIVMCRVVRMTKITGSRLDDWIY